MALGLRTEIPLGRKASLTLESQSFGATVFGCVLVAFQYLALQIFAPLFALPSSNAVHFYPVLGAACVLAYNFFDRFRAGGRAIIDPALACCFVFVAPIIWHHMALSSHWLVTGYALIAMACCGPLVLEAITKARQAVLLVLVACLFGAAIFLLANALLNSDVFALPRTVAGLLQIDTLYHGAIASMILEHGVPSIGIDGVIQLRYHVFSHVWLGYTGQIAGIDPLTAYILGRQIVLLPLMFFAVKLVLHALSGGRESRSWIGAAAYMVVLFAFTLFDWNSYLISDSHICGMIFLLFGILFLKNWSSASSIAGFVMAGFCLVLLATLSKISAGYILFAGLGYFVLVFRYVPEQAQSARTDLDLRSVAGVLATLKGYAKEVLDGMRRMIPAFWSAFWRARKTEILAFVVLSVVLLLFATRVVMQESHAGDSRFFPFYFGRFFKIALLNFGVTAAALWICIWRRPPSWDRALCHILAVSMAAGALPALLFKIEYAGAYYFINISALLALPVLAAWIVQRPEWDHPRAPIVAIAVVLLAAPLHVVLSGSYRTFTRGLDRVETVLTGRSTAEQAGPFNQARLAAVMDAARQTPLARMSEAIRAERDKRVRQIVYLMPGVDDANPYSCQLRPFVVPAMTGLPRLAGRPDAQCDIGPHYGYVDYRLEQKIAEPVTDAKICAAAKLRAFAHVIVVEDAGRARRLDCPR
jgi:hypothetical protein